MRMQGKRHNRCRLPSAAALLLLTALLQSPSLPSPYLASATLTTASSSTSSASPLVPPVRPFELRDVSLAPDSFQYRAAASNTEYLLQLEPDRMLWAFRNNAKLPTPGVPFYGSWEDPGCELRGHFVGHYLTALSLVVMSTGNATLRSRLDYYVDELARVQEVLSEDGYLSAFPSEHIDRVEALQPVWAPYYVIHKIMAGLLDAHLLVGNHRALEVVVKMANYHLKRSDKVVEEKGADYWQRTLATEFGGMNDVAYRLYRVTGDEGHLRLARLFDKAAFFEPLIAGRDALAGHHANTHLAQVVGFAERVEATGDSSAATAVRNFFTYVTGPHAYATGGSSDKEFWFEPWHLGEAVTDKADSSESQETCTQYNVLKIARSLFTWTGDVKLADFYERALVNGILGVSRLTNEEVHGAGRAHTHRHHHRHQDVLSAALGTAAEQATAAAGGAAAGSSAGAGEAGEGEVLSPQVNVHRRLKVHAGDGDHNHLNHLHNHPHDQVHNHHNHQHHRELWDLASADLPHHRFRSRDVAERAEAHAHALSYEQQQHGAAGDDGGSQGALHGADTLPSHRRPFATRFQDYWGMNLAKMPFTANATNAPGTPGVFLYLLPMGAGQSKGDNYHKWSYPFHAFWCCVGTAIESFAKLADSIYFHADPETPHGPPRLHVNQLVSSSLSWREQGVQVTQTADMFVPGSIQQQAFLHQKGMDDLWEYPLFVDRPWQARMVGPSGSALLTISTTSGKPVRFALLLRMPQWSDPRRTVITVAGTEWRRCPGFPSPSSYCTITREWQHGDKVEVSLGLTYWLKPLGDAREQYKDLQAVMMGPYVMAGLTHDARWLQLPAAARSPDGLAALVSEPGDPEELVSIQAAWNASLFLRHDLYHAHVSEIEDGGDGIDATFRLVRGCTLPTLSPGTANLRAHHTTSASSVPLSAAAAAAAAAAAGHAGSFEAASSLHHAMRNQMLVGLRDDHAVMFESMNMPGFYLGAESADGVESVESSQGRPQLVLTLTQPSPRAPTPTATTTSTTSSAAAAATQMAAKESFCKRHQFMIRQGLDGRSGTVSLESVAFPGAFVTAAPPAVNASCTDSSARGMDCDKAARQGLCVSQPDVYKVRCRRSCGSCASLDTVLRLAYVSGSSPDPALAAATSFRMAEPLVPTYPPGSKVLAGRNRRYLVAPLGNLVDERYTTYFNVVE